MVETKHEIQTLYNRIMQKRHSLGNNAAQLIVDDSNVIDNMQVQNPANGLNSPFISPRYSRVFLLELVLFKDNELIQIYNESALIFSIEVLSVV